MTQTNVCIAIPTYRRPERLTALLDALGSLERPPACTLEALVIDNDPAQSAAPVVAGIDTRLPFPLSYANVPQRGLSSVRNHALSHACTGFDFLAMIDDDEVPQPQWLAELMRVQAATQADAVIGAVPQVLPDDASRWLRKGRFYDLPVYADGAPMNDGYSGNCLLNVRTIERIAVRFDPDLNFAGGEDLMFFRQWLAQGATLAYARRAIAEEHLPPERLRVAYLLRLYFRRGNILSFCDRKLRSGLAPLGVRGLKAAARVVRGGTMLVPRAVLQGRSGTVAALCDIAHGLGGLVGLFGLTYQAYQRAIS